MKSHLDGTWRDLEKVRDLSDPLALEMVQGNDRAVVRRKLRDGAPNEHARLLAEQQLLDARKVADRGDDPAAGAIELGVRVLERLLAIATPGA